MTHLSPSRFARPEQGFKSLSIVPFETKVEFQFLFDLLSHFVEKLRYLTSSVTDFSAFVRVTIFIPNDERWIPSSGSILS